MSCERVRADSSSWDPTTFNVEHLAIDVARAVRREKEDGSAISRGSPKRFMGFMALASSMCSGETPHSCSQLPEIGPGAKALTRMSGAMSRARAAVKPRIAPLAAQ